MVDTPLLLAGPVTVMRAALGSSIVKVGPETWRQRMLLTGWPLADEALASRIRLAPDPSSSGAALLVPITARMLCLTCTRPEGELMELPAASRSGKVALSSKLS